MKIKAPETINGFSTPFWKHRKNGELYGLTYFINDRLWAVVMEDGETGPRILERESVSFDAEAQDEARENFQKKIESFQGGSLTWLHLILRCSGLVRTFGLPASLKDPVEASLHARVKEEIPHLIDEVIYHARIQQNGDAGKREGILFGIPKNVLKEQFARLERVNLFPAQFMLSTEILSWHRARVNAEAQRHEQPVFLQAHAAGGQGELLYMKGEAVLHSQWLKTEMESGGALEDAIQAANESFKRSTGEMPFETLLDEDNSRLFSAAVEAYRSRAVFDFSPAELESRRAQRDLQTSKRGLWRTLVFLSLSLFIFSTAQILSTGAQLGWIQAQSDALSGSVSEIKKLRQEALAYQKFQSRKTAPVVLINSLRQSIPSGLILTNLEFDAEKSEFFVRGEAERKDLDDYLAALQSEGRLEASLNRVEAQPEKGGRIAFELSGVLKDKR